MDAASKRVMWQTLAEVTAGRSLLLTVKSHFARKKPISY
jgi:hypothetical protein